MPRLGLLSDKATRWSDFEASLQGPLHASRRGSRPLTARDQQDCETMPLQARPTRWSTSSDTGKAGTISRNPSTEPRCDSAPACDFCQLICPSLRHGMTSGRSSTSVFVPSTLLSTSPTACCFLDRRQLDLGTGSRSVSSGCRAGRRRCSRLEGGARGGSHVADRHLEQPSTASSEVSTSSDLVGLRLMACCTGRSL